MNIMIGVLCIVIGLVVIICFAPAEKDEKLTLLNGHWKHFYIIGEHSNGEDIGDLRGLLPNREWVKIKRVDGWFNENYMPLYIDGVQIKKIKDYMKTITVPTKFYPKKFGVGCAKFDGNENYIELLEEGIDIEKLDIDNNGIGFEAWVDIDTDGKKVFHFKTLPKEKK